MEVKLEEIRTIKTGQSIGTQVARERLVNAAREKWMKQHYVANGSIGRQTPYNYDLIQEELAEALQQEKEYERCSYIQTHSQQGFGYSDKETQQWLDNED